MKRKTNLKKVCIFLSDGEFERLNVVANKEGMKHSELAKNIVIQAIRFD